jgi:hypothetical protein
VIPTKGHDNNELQGLFRESAKQLKMQKINYLRDQAKEKTVQSAAYVYISFRGGTASAYSAIILSPWLLALF